MSDQENWRAVVGWPEYEVSDFGRVRRASTVSENILHGYRQGRCNATGEANGYAKLTDETVVEIRTLAQKDRRNFGELAERFNVSKATIYDVVARRTWTHLLAA